MVLCRFAVGRIESLELVFTCGRRRPLCCQTTLRLVQGGWGEVFAVAGLRDATVVWAEGLHSGWNARKKWAGIAPGPSKAQVGPPS